MRLTSESNPGGLAAFAAIVAYALADRPPPATPAHAGYVREHRQRVADLRAALATAGVHAPATATLSELRALAAAGPHEEQAP
jgi:hypothetical protein